MKTVVAESVTVGYRPGEPVLREVSLTAEPGQLVGDLELLLLP
jgi:ABC-type multidrug transport system fused ATPase/permease subunit